MKTESADTFPRGTLHPVTPALGSRFQSVVPGFTLLTEGFLTGVLVWLILITLLLLTLLGLVIWHFWKPKHAAWGPRRKEDR